eukprot:EST41944.1 DinF protein [Spironucleus salmonicida]
MPLVAKALAADQYSVSVHTMMSLYLIFMFGVILCVGLYFGFMNQMVTQFETMYYVMALLLGSIFSAFQVTMSAFFMVENRGGIMFCRDFIGLCLRTTVLIVVYNIENNLNHDQKPSLLSPGIAQLISYIVLCIISFVAATQFDTFDLQFSGILKFSLKKINPIRPRVIIKLFLNFLPALGCNATDFVALLLANYFIIFSIDTEQEKIIRIIQNSIFCTFAFICIKLNTIISETYIALASTNFGVKKISRVYAIFKHAAVMGATISLFMSVIVVVLGRFLIQVFFRKLDDFMYIEDLITRCQDAMMYAGIYGFQRIISGLGISAIVVEGLVKQQLVIVLPRLCTIIGGVVSCHYLLGSMANYPMIICIGEISGVAAGIPTVVWFWIKYKQVASTDAKVIKEEEQLTNNEMVQNIRITIAESINAEEEDEEMLKAKQGTITGVANKQLLLRESLGFRSLASTVDRQSAVLEE